jgi:hypothetical protein
MGLQPYRTMDDVAADVQTGHLVGFDGVAVSGKLPEARRYALPETVEFAAQLNREYRQRFHCSLTVDSAVRAAETQVAITRANRGHVAPAYGTRVSSHEFGTTFDLSKRMTKAETRWLVTRLLYYRAIGRILVIQEKGCFHIFVGGDDE